MIAERPRGLESRPGLGGTPLDTRLLIRIAITAALLLLFGAHAAGGWPLPFLDRLEDMAYDSRVRLAMPGTVDPRVVIVDVDERSLAAEGRWPWPRDKVATLVEALVDRYRVRVVAFDMNFPEPDDPRAARLLEALAAQGLADEPRFARAYAELAPALDTDARLARAIAGRPVVLGFVLHPSRSPGEGQRLGAAPPPLFAAGADDEGLRLVEARGLTGNLPALQAAARAGGYFSNPLVDADGAFRRLPLLQAWDGGVHESLALATLRVALDAPPPTFGFAGADGAPRDNVALEWIGVGALRVPVDAELAARVPYRGPAGSFPYLAATDVLRGAVDPAALDGAIALVGTSAPGLLDLRNTPVGEGYPGVEIHANLIAGMLDQRVMAAPAWAPGAHLLLLLAVAVLSTWLQVRHGVGTVTLASAALVVALVAGNLAAWRWGGLVLPLAAPLAFALALFFVHALYGFFVESRGVRLIRAQFGQYVPPELVGEMASHHESFTFAGQTREMTVLFSDVRDFTSISEGLGPEALAALMNAYLTPMTAVIHGQRGTIDKYIGDAIMAFWGAPLPDAEHARHAVHAALGMEQAAARLSQEFVARGWPAIRIGVGLSTGPMQVGDMGSRFRRQYTVMGDAVNLGSRLEGLTKEYGVTVLASAATRDAVPEVQFLELDRVRVKGRAQPVSIHAPLGPRDALDAATRQLVRRHEAALEAYRAQRWDDAEREFFALFQEHGRGHHRLFLDRIGRFRAAPPPAGWDGVYSHATKK